jgi:hypothetical protein
MRKQKAQLDVIQAWDSDSEMIDPLNRCSLNYVYAHYICTDTDYNILFFLQAVAE